MKQVMELDTDYYRDLVRSLPYNMAVIDREGTIIETNKNWDDFGQQHGLNRDDLEQNRNYFDVCERGNDESARRALDGIKAVVSGERDHFRMEYPCHDDNHRRWFIMQVYPFESSGSSSDFYVVIHVDITERRLSEEKSRRLSAIVHKIPVCVATLQHLRVSEETRSSNGESGAREADREVLVVADFNPHAETVTGLDHSEVLGKNYRQAFVTLFGEELEDKILDVFRSNKNLEIDEIVSGKGNFEGRKWNLKIFKLTDDYVSIVFEDVTEAVENRRQLEYLATYDELTGLPNRDKLLETFRAELNRAQRYENPLSFLLFDLDQFKAVNDTYGHMAGDEVLEELGKLLRNETRDPDTPGRYGGEEFGVVLAETPVEEACHLAKRLRDGIESLEIKTNDGVTLGITASIGVSGRKEDDGAIEDVLRRADEALYEAKDTGGNCVVCSR